MDTIIALNVAVAVLEFVEFASSVLKDPRGARQGGKPLSLKDFDRNSDQALHQVECLRSGLVHVKNNQSLGKITLDCINVAQQLVHGLQSLSLALSGSEQRESNSVPAGKSKSTRSNWTSFRQGLRTIWTAEHDTTLRSRIESIPAELASSLLATLTCSVEVRSTLNSSSLIDEVLAFMSKDVPTLIITLKDGQTHTITVKAKADLKAEQYNRRLDKQALYITSPTGPVTGPKIALRSLDHAILTKTVLDGLSFRQIRDRVDDIQEAHESTFNWIFEQVPEQRWSDFPKWLESEVDLDGGQRVYWVNGKAGSGKSTLLKFISEDARTWSRLNKWAPTKTLVSASFFFWALGTRQQITHQGLLRSLLHDVLEQSPDLIPAVIPEVVKQLVTSSSHSNSGSPNHAIHEPSLSQLQTWFRRLIAQASETFRLFFQIDGIDEYEGDLNDLIALITNASSSSKHVKFLVSSRPIPCCVETFTSSPGLQLHSLTRADMIRYCDSMIGKQLSKRPQNHQDRAMFIQELVDKSSGVFLWVILVVKSIQNGVRSRANDLATLRASLDEMPTDLTELYSHIVRHTIPVEFRSEASRIFQIFQRSQEVERGIRGLPGLLGIQLFFALESDTLDRDYTDPLTRQQEKRVTKDVRNLLLTGCSGLLELQTRRESSGQWRKKRVKSLAEHVLSVGVNPVSPHIGFIHRTVAEFMKDKKVWSDIKSWSNQNDRNGSTYQALFKSCVAMAKRLPSSVVVHPRGSLVWETTYTGLRYAQLAEQSGQPILMEDLDAFDEAFDQHWNNAQVYLQEGGKYESVQGRHWSSIFFQFNDGETPDGGPTWTHSVRSNRDNGVRSLATCSSTDYEMVHSTTQHLGFLRLAIVYGLGSFIHAKLASRETTVVQITDTLSFWRNFLMSSFPLRLKVPAGVPLAASLMLTGISLGQSDSDAKSFDAEGAFALWNIFLMELCSARDLRKMTPEQVHQVVQLVSEFVKLPFVSESMATGSGRFGKLLVQLGTVLKSKQQTDGPGLFEMMNDVVSAMEANHATIYDVQNKDMNAQLKVNVPNRPVGRGSNLKRQFSPGTPSTNSVSSMSAASSGNDSGSCDPSSRSVSSLVKIGLGLFKELANTWFVSIQVARKTRGREVISAKGVLQMVKNNTRKLKLPMAKKRAIWREWEVAGVQPTRDRFSGL